MFSHIELFYWTYNFFFVIGNMNDNPVSIIPSGLDARDVILNIFYTNKKIQMGGVVAKKRIIEWLVQMALSFF